MTFAGSPNWTTAPLSRAAVPLRMAHSQLSLVCSAHFTTTGPLISPLAVAQISLKSPGPKVDDPLCDCSFNSHLSFQLWVPSLHFWNLNITLVAVFLFNVLVFWDISVYCRGTRVGTFCAIQSTAEDYSLGLSHNLDTCLLDLSLPQQKCPEGNFVLSFFGSFWYGAFTLAVLKWIGKKKSIIKHLNFFLNKLIKPNNHLFPLLIFFFLFNALRSP